MTRFALLALILFLALPAFAGSRGVEVAFLDATTGTRSKASLRLAELLVMDMRSLYLDDRYAEIFPWSEKDLKLHVIKPSEAGLTFDSLLNTKDSKKISALLLKKETQDGLIVFFHDPKNGFARLKLFDSEGKECLLLRLPFEGKDSAMPSSLLKHHRRGALTSIG
ncbi:hypothetical protein N9A94_06375, partial [Akkermansiaceae bacterium]|nr:hypothetical protein [Akkermansiaceae bacterium]